MKLTPTNHSFWQQRALALAAIVAGFLWLPSLRAQSSLPFYEPFPSTYGNGTQLGAGNTTALWTFGNGASSSCARIETYAALAYPGLTNIDAAGQTYGLMSYIKDSSSVKDRAVPLAIPSSTSGIPVYASCLVNFLSFSNATAAFFGLTANTGGSSVSHVGAVVYINPAGALQIAKNNSSTPSTNATYSLSLSNTYLLVIRYKYNPGALDQVDLWLDPTALGNDAAVPAPTLTITNNANLATNYFGAVGYFQSAGPSLFYVDEIRVATNWSGVTPANVPAGMSYSVTGGGVGCAGASFNVALSGSDAGVNYLLYTNGVFSGQNVAGTGSAVSFGLQNVTALYTVLATNTATATANWMSGSASVSVTPAPNIAAQPVAALVATNALAAFTVSPGGGGLSCQWYRNGSALTDGGHLAGTQTTNLVISPATTADAATVANGYYAKISNPCGGFVYSTTNALTLHPPATLVWYGDGVSNLWDVATSTNWNYSSALGYPTNQFNFGDNVIFDDTSASSTVVLANPDLSPSTLTVNGSGSKNYTFNGGVLAGPGSLVMNSLGTLTLAIQNNATGGLTISNGIVFYSTPNALGGGTITLAGGALDAPGYGLIYLNNAINITGSNSIIGAQSPGGQPLVLAGALTATGGTLIFSNTTAKSASPNIEISMTNLALNIPVTLNVGTVSGAGLNLLGYNTSGTQTWNNLITGGGGLQRTAVGGTTLLLNTNSYSGVTKLSNGGLGVGCDSFASSPPTVDYGPLGTGTFTIDTTSGGPLQLFAVGGPHVIANPINWATTASGAAFIVGGSNGLALTGSMDLNGNNRVIQADNPAGTILSGVITDNGGGYGLTKTGNGALYLDGANTYSGVTTNSAGLLAGSGSVPGVLVVNSGASLGAGDAGAAPGTFHISGDLTLNGNVFIRLNKSFAQSNDLITAYSGLANTGTGTVNVTNAGPPLAVGDAFTIFSQPVVNGEALTITGAGVTWSNSLAADGSIVVTGIAGPTVITIPPAITSFNLAGSNVVISGTNGQSGGTAYLLVSTNLTRPLNQWKTVATNVLGGNAYTFIGTNAVTDGPQSFYLLSSTNYNP
ncbi:MAG: hypothetical protein P4N60_12090 [Verrucomicrobiae bacterium]|nr:hypothetical protein [Verrucomicrobiae bacterium]